MPKGPFTSADAIFAPQLGARLRVKIGTLARRCAVSPLGLPSFRSFREFHCPDCYGQKAYLSRCRSVFEKGFLFLLMLKPVRCERCFHRSYAFRTVPVLERVALAGKLDSQSESNSGAGTRVA